MPENEKDSITENERQSSVPPKKGWFDLVRKVTPLVIAIVAIIGLIFTIHNFIHNHNHIHDRDKGNGGANLTNRRSELFSSLASQEIVTNDGGTVINGAFAEGGGGMGFISRKKGDVITFPTSFNIADDTYDFTNMAEGTVELCVTLTQDLKADYDYYLFSVHEGENAVILKIAWNAQQGYHYVRLRIKPGRETKAERVYTREIKWQQAEHHHIAATWGTEGMRLYIDGEINIADQIKQDGRYKHNVAVERNLHGPFAINNNHYDGIDATAPTHCIVRNFRISNYQRTEAEVKESYATLHPKDERE